MRAGYARTILSARTHYNIVFPAPNRVGPGIQGMANISGLFGKIWIPAFAGMTEKGLNFDFSATC